MRGIHIRIEDTIYQDIEQMATARGITMSHLVRELIEVGIRIKKHMENKKSAPQEEAPQINSKYLEIGTSSAIEVLLLLRKLVKENHPEWVEEIHAEAAQRISKLKD